MPRFMVSRYPSRCLFCGQCVTVAEAVNRRHKPAICENCANSSKALFDALKDKPKDSLMKEEGNGY